MLSVLIPTYNYNVFSLVNTIRNQCVKENISFEILIFDDASEYFQLENNKINSLEGCTYTILHKNIGRSKIRNLLAKTAKYDWLLFLDADVFPVNDQFIFNYLQHISISNPLVYGGIVYDSEKPEKELQLRWRYGKSREALSVHQRNKNSYLSFLTLNFLCHKSVFNTLIFNEDIPNLRHEDTLFSYELKLKNIPVLHIENPVIHLGLDTFEKAIQKEHESLFALKNLVDLNLIDSNYVKMASYFYQLKRWNLVPLLNYSFKIARPFLLKNLSGNNPSLIAFDLYRLGYLSTIK